MSPRVAVIGAGGMGRFHAQALAALPHVELAEICDPYPSDALEPLGASITTDPAACAAAGWDGVVIASPDETHAELTLLALEAGSRVLCEKPLSHDADGSRAVCEWELERGVRRVQVGLMREYDAAHSALADEMARLGALHHLRCTHRNNNAAPRPPATVIVQSLIHDIHTVRWLGGEVRDLSVHAIDRAGGGLTHVLLTMYLVTGASATVEFSDETYAYEVEVEATLDGGMVSTPPPSRPRLRVDGSHLTPIGNDWFGWFADAYRTQDRAWVASLGHDTAEGPSAWDSHAAERVGIAAVSALARGGGAATLEPLEVPGLYRR